MRRIGVTTVMLCLLLPAAPTGVVAGDPPTAVTELVGRAKQEVPLLDRDGFAGVVAAVAAGRRQALIIDVREPGEYSAGHVPGAVNIPRGVIEFRIWDHLETAGAAGAALYLYCGWGSRAALAAQALSRLGVDGVVAVDMQLADWQAAGLPFTVP